MKKINLSIIISVLIMILAAALVIAAENENRGGEILKVDGGSKGEVTFPHKEHQDNLKDCKLCHDTFPQKLGVIKEMKDKKELKRKQVMNDVCLKCHKDYKKANKAYGPINCNGCHG
ncbi:MAG: cytochrome c3 family protein [Desulfamplus sp.]|nr:cytochrome c3 family protein [Desulfamplus sp.]MBF0259557.1 cytochrome c3 family protein [Desulfamplus sp.]